MTDNVFLYMVIRYLRALFRAIFCFYYISFHLVLAAESIYNPQLPGENKSLHLIFDRNRDIKCWLSYNLSLSSEYRLYLSCCLKVMEQLTLFKKNTSSCSVKKEEMWGRFETAKKRPLFYYFYFPNLFTHLILMST